MRPHRSARLMKNLIPCGLGGFRCEVRILDPAAGCGDVLHRSLQARHGRLETALERAEGTPEHVHVADGLVDAVDRML